MRQYDDDGKPIIPEKKMTRRPETLDVRFIDRRRRDGRVETGAVQFDDDWPGVFIRGKHAFVCKMALENLLTPDPELPDALRRMYESQVRSLINLLDSSNVRNQR